MFTGIIEAAGAITHIQPEGSNRNIWISAPFRDELKIDQSVAHNGVCLTVVEITDDSYRVTAVRETLQKTTLQRWEIGDHINLERALRAGDRLDGHFVQGHVDGIAQCTAVVQQDGSWILRFAFDEAFAPLLIEKGSVCLDGISLTAFDVARHSFAVTIIPYTWEHTNLRRLTTGSWVNIEYDVMGKYMLRHRALQQL